MASRIYHQTSSTGESTTTSSSYQDKAALTFTPDANSTYLIIATWLFQAQGIGVAAYSQLYNATGSASLSEQIYTPKDISDYISGGCAVTAAFGSSPPSQTYKVQYKSDGTETAAIKAAHIIAIKLTANDQYASSTGRDTYSTNTAYQDKVTKTWTPAAGDYLILASAVMDHAFTTYQALPRIDVDGSAQYGAALIQVNNTGNRMGYTYFQKVTLTGASHTIKLQYATESAGRAVGIASAYLTILSVADLPALIAAAQDTPQTDTDASKDHALTADFSAAAAEDHLILACGLFSCANTNSSGSVGLYEGVTDLGTTTLQEPMATDATYPYIGSYFTADPADTYYVDILAESASYDATVDDIRIYGIQLEVSITNVSATDTLLLKYGTETGAAPVGSLSATDTLLLTFGTETTALNTVLSATDTLLLKYGTETGAAPVGSLSATDTLLLKFGTESGMVLTTLVNVSASDSLLLQLNDTSTSIYKILYPTATDTLLFTVGESSASIGSLLLSEDTLLLKYGTESSLYPAATLSATDTLLLKYGTESSLYPAATLTGADTLLIDPGLEAADLIASLVADDTLLLSPTWDSGSVGNLHGACEDPVRAIHGKVQITYSDPSLNEAVTITAIDTAYGTDADHTADNISGSDYMWFSLQENDLSGWYHPMPDVSVGWWSNTVSDANGAFSPAVTLTVEMEDARPIYDLKVCGDDKLNNFPVDFAVTLYDSADTLLYTETVTANTLWNWTKTLTAYVNGVDKMVLSITKISQPSRSAIVTEFFTAYSETYEDSDILFMSLLEERDYSGGTLPIGNVSSNEITVRLNNINDHFSVDNVFSPIYNLMKKNRRIEAWIGIEVPFGGDISWEPLGVFWSQDWSTPQDQVYAEVVGFDRLERFRDTEFYSEQVYVDYSLTDLAEVILSAAGLIASEYVIHSDLDSIVVPYSYFGRTTIRDALVEIAEAAMGTVYTDRAGRIVITPYVDETQPSYTLSSNQYFTKDQPLAFSEIVNYVEVRATPRTPSTQQDIYTDSEEIAVPAGESVDVFCIYNTSDPCIDIQTATFTQSASDITITAQTDYTWATSLTFTNGGGTSQNVTGITIQGKVLEPAGEKVAFAEDANSIRLNGRQALQSPVENEFIQSKARAQAIATALLAAYKDPRRDVVVQARGYIMSQIGERMTVQSLNGWQSDDYTITRQELEYDGGLRVEMSGQLIPGSGVKSLPQLPLE